MILTAHSHLQDFWERVLHKIVEDPANRRMLREFLYGYDGARLSYFKALSCYYCCGGDQRMKRGHRWIQRREEILMDFMYPVSSPVIYIPG